MKRLVFSVALATLFAEAAPLSAQEATMDYTVVEGDTCEKLAAKFFGDPKRYDKLHALNPQMGPVPHKLVPGTILKVERPGPLAKVTFVRRDVDAATPGTHKAKLEEPLAQGNKVTTQADSSAEVTFKDQSRIQLSEHTLVVILGGTMHLADKQATSADTQLMTGELRAHLGSLVGKKPIATPGATVDLGAGEAKVDVDGKKTTRLAVYKGKSTLAASGKKVEVPQGFGSKADLGKAPTKPRPLPDATRWTAALPRVTLTFADTADVSGAYAAGTGTGPAAATFHVQLSRDLAFNDLVLDARVPASITKLEAKNLSAGTYYARVSGLDDDKFEGAYGDVATLTVAKVVAVSAPGQSPKIEVPKGLFCGFDGAPLAAVDAPLEVPPGKQHALACATTADGAGAATLLVDGASPAAKVEPPPSVAPPAPSPQPPLSAPPPFRRFELGLGAGGAKGGERLGTGATFALDGSYNERLGTVAIVAVGARIGFEKYGVRPNDPGSSLDDGDAFVAAVPVTLRLVIPGGTFMPFVALAPQVLLERVETASGRESRTGFGLSMGGGLRIALASRVWLATEVGYRLAEKRDVEQTPAGFRGVYETLGLRVGF